MGDRLRFRLPDRGMRESLERKTGARVGDAEHEHSRRADSCDPNLPIGIKLTAPFDGVEQQFPEAGGNGFADTVRKVSLQLHYECLNPLGSLPGARNQEFNPVGTGRQDLYGWLLIVGQRSLRNFDGLSQRKWFAQVVVGLLLHRT